MIDTILSAAEFKVKMDAKRVLLNAVQGSPKPEVAKAFLEGVLRVLVEEFNRVLVYSPSAPTSISLSLDAAQIGIGDRADISPLLIQIRTYLISLGYGVNVANGVATISW
jgi:hypothetical protein